MIRFTLATLAGTIAFFTGGFLIHGLILVPEWTALTKTLGVSLSGEMPPTAMAIFMLANIGRALGAVLLVKMLRPCVGCPFATAGLAGFGLWALTSGLPRLVEAPIGIYPPGFLAKAAGLELIPPILAAAAAVAILPRPEGAASCGAEESRV